MLRLEFDREVRVLLRHYARRDGVWEITDRGFLNHSTSPPLLLTDAEVWWQLSDPPACDNRIFLEGEHIYTISPETQRHVVEVWVRQVAQLSGQPVDWHVFAGRRVILTTGNVSKVLQAIEDLRSLLIKLQLAAWEDYDSRLGENYRPPIGGYIPDANRPILWPLDQQATA